MSDIFLSYSSEDRSWAKLLAACLQKQGWSVWWDRTIPTGKIYTKIIEAALSSARYVVVIWSHESVDSNWVQEEATEGRDRGILVPVFKENAKPPMGFRSFQAADLSGWDGNLESSEFKKLVQDLTFILGPPEQPPQVVEPSASITYPLPADHKGLEFKVAEPELTEPPSATPEELPPAPEPIKPTSSQIETVEAELIEPKPAKPLPPKPETKEPESVKPKPFEPWEPQTSEVTKRSRLISIGVPVGLVLLVVTLVLWWFVSGGPSGKRPAQVKPSPESTAPKVITNNLGMKFMLIPAGTFLMGSSMSPEEVDQKYGGNAEKFDNERPQHKVTISKPFYLQSTPVTQGQWKRVMRGIPSSFRECGEDCPVEKVSWDNAQEFIKKLNEMEKTDKYRLPTEAEWEYACRAGSTGSFSFGDNENELKEYAWYNRNSQNRLHPVGRLKPNAWGLYDMHGNVWEWCQDRYGKYPAGPVTDPKGPASGTERVFRGGSWASPARSTRSATRGHVIPDDRTNDGSFRVAMSL